jgi:hypothetical protein
MTTTPTTIHPNTQALLDFFAYDHLPPHLQAASKPFHDLAQRLAQVPGAETTVALRKLLEAKDCGVRAELAATKLGWGRKAPEITEERIILEATVVARLREHHGIDDPDLGSRIAVDLVELLQPTFVAIGE